MALRRSRGEKVDVTDPIDVSFGAFELGRYRVPFMSAILRFQQIAEYVSLVTENPKYATQDWTIAELFQRELDHGRVFEMAGKYLNPARATRPPFFNSLTIALMPRPEIQCEPLSREKDSEYQRFVSCGPIVSEYSDVDGKGDYPAPGSHGILRWNRGAVYAVAIDGQHRLGAIKQLWRSNPDACRACFASVLFLVMDKRFGLLAPDEMDPIALMRSVFIDLNKHAVAVSRARNLLLDDQSPHARFVRELVGPSLLYRPTDADSALGFKRGESGEFDERIPLELVDWHGESKSKVEFGPYATSVLALEWIVNRVLGSKKPGLCPVELEELDPDDPEYYKQVEDVLRKWPESFRTQLEARLRESKKTEVVFRLSVGDVEILGGEFRKSWGRPIVRLLTTAGPYRSLAEMRLKHKTLSPKFGQWWQAEAAFRANSKSTAAVLAEYKLRRDNVEAALKEESVSVAEFREHERKITEDLKKDCVLFYLVGQRAMFRTLVEFVEGAHAAEWADAIGVDLSAFAGCIQDFYAYYISEAISAYYDTGDRDDRNGVLFRGFSVERRNKQTERVSDCFWAGSLLDRNDPQKVDFSDQASKRGSRWFSLLVHLYWFIKVNRKELPRKGKKLVDDFDVLLREHDRLCSMKLGGEVLTSLSRVHGSSQDSRVYYDCPMAYLATDSKTGDGVYYDEELAKLAALERILPLVPALMSP